jgi:hypothetical protein
MSLLTKSDLKYTYSWTAINGDNPKISGEPDNTLFNRHEGYEVLYLINKFAEIYNFKQKASGLKLEEMIKNHLPSEVRSQINVKQWLKNNWNNY